MRLIHANVRNYRIHRELRVDFDPRRTLIGGLNESGKSTLIEAIHRALFLKARIMGEAQKGMTSLVHPGVPEVELRFECGGRTYDLRKRFAGGSGTTRLSDDTGNSLQNDEAESRLADLLGVESLGGGRGAGERVAQQWGHLWVWQGEAGDDPSDHANRQQTSLLRRLQTMGGAAALQSERDARVARQFAEARDSIFTQPGRPKAGSELARAEQALAYAEAELTRATERLNKLDQNATDLESATRDQEAASKSLETLQGEQRQVESKVRQLTDLRQRETEQAQQAQTAAAQHVRLEEANNSILTLRRESTELEGIVAPRMETVRRLEKARDECRQKLAEAEIASRAATDATRAARLRHELATAHSLLFEKTELHTKLEDKAQAVEQRRKAIANLLAEWAQLPKIERSKLQKIQKLEAQCSAAGAALQAMATGLEVLASDHPVVAGDTAVGIGERQILTEDTELRIGSSIRLRILPGGGTSLADARQAEQAALEKLHLALDALGLSSVQAAADVCNQRDDLGARIQAGNAELEGMGADQLVEELQSAQNELSAAKGNVSRLMALVPDPEVPADKAAAKSMVQATKEAHELAETAEDEAGSSRKATAAAFESSEETLTQNRQELAKQQRKSDDLKAQLALLLKTHGDDDARTHALVRSQATRITAEAALGATRDAIALLQPELLETDRERLNRAIQQKTNEKNDARTRIEVARNALRLDGAEDPQTAFADAQARSRFASNHRDSELRKARAIELLHQLFQEEQRTLAEQFTQPLADKISGYLRCLFGPDARAEVSLDNGQFSGLRFLRPSAAGAALPFDDLSGGAREQVAAAVRLAMAEVLAADHNGCLPVVFDDAFAYSDPERVTQLQRMLDLAANRGLQVIVLTCNPSDYAALGANSINLQPSPKGLSSLWASPAPSGQDIPAAIPSSPDETFISTQPTTMVTAELREIFLAALDAVGGSVGNHFLRLQLDWDETTYNAVKRNLIDIGTVIPGRGRGGSVTRV